MPNKSHKIYINPYENPTGEEDVYEYGFGGRKNAEGNLIAQRPCKITIRKGSAVFEYSKKQSFGRNV